MARRRGFKIRSLRLGGQVPALNPELRSRSGGKPFDHLERLSSNRSFDGIPNNSIPLTPKRHRPRFGKCVRFSSDQKHWMTIPPSNSTTWVRFWSHSSGVSSFESIPSLNP